MELKLDDYQVDFSDNIIKELKENKTVCAQLATGGGKTVVFSYICNRFIENTKKDVLILVHRQELLKQTRRALFTWYQVVAQEISANTKSIHSEPMFSEDKTRIYVAMVETFDRRSSNTFFMQCFKNIGLIIVDECHLSNFKKVFKHFQDSYIIGFSATPISAVKKDPLKNHYKKIICGITIRELIEYNNINKERGVVQDLTFVKQNISYERVVALHKEKGLFGDSFSDEIVGKEMSGKKYVQNCIDAYLDKCYGKKILIFNSNVEHSKLVTKSFQEVGLNCRHIDGTCDDDYRKDIFKWLKDTDNAILCNVGIATTGFDDPSIEGSIINKPTKSLTLWKQMCGRSARPYKYKDGTYKNHHLIIDLGDNVIGAGHGEWSDDVDWEFLFNNPKVPSKQGVAPVKLCPVCGYINPVSTRFCLGEEPGLVEGDVIKCGYEFPREVIEDTEQKITLVCVSKNVDVDKIVTFFSNRDMYHNFYEIVRQIAYYTRRDINYNLLTQEDFDMIYKQGEIKIKQWTKIYDKKFTGSLVNMYKKSLLEKLYEQNFILED